MPDDANNTIATALIADIPFPFCVSFSPRVARAHVLRHVTIKVTFKVVATPDGRAKHAARQGVATTLGVTPTSVIEGAAEGAATR
jgi:hypothetical protein